MRAACERRGECCESCGDMCGERCGSCGERCRSGERCKSCGERCTEPPFDSDFWRGAMVGESESGSASLAGASTRFFSLLDCFGAERSHAPQCGAAVLSVLDELFADEASSSRRRHCER